MAAPSGGGGGGGGAAAAADEPKKEEKKEEEEEEEDEVCCGPMICCSCFVCHALGWLLAGLRAREAVSRSPAASAGLVSGPQGSLQPCRMVQRGCAQFVLQFVPLAWVCSKAVASCLHLIYLS